MIQNIKLDVIYYMGAKDFEMEFNLCGCCRMRLLTDQVKDHKSFIHALSRAVSRSRVIMCVGPLFGDDGLIKNVSEAVRIPLETVENQKFGIRTSSQIEIIKGALPLVTSDGIFGGCIVESGPQSIILLSESKSVRKSVMTSLIHPYIEELSIASATPSHTNIGNAAANQEVDVIEEDDTVQSNDDDINSMTVGAVVAAATDDAVDIFSSTIASVLPDDNNGDDDSINQTTITAAVEDDDSDDNTIVGTVAAAENDDDTSDEDDAVEEDDDDADDDDDSGDNTAQQHEGFNAKIDLYIEPQRVKFSKKNYYDTDYDYGEQSELYYSGVEDDEYRNRRSLRVPVMIFTAILLLAVLVLIYLLVFVPMRDGYSFTQYIDKLFEPAARLTRIIGG